MTNIDRISSAANPTFRRWKSLLGSKGIRKHGEALVSGKRIAHELCGRRPELVQTWLASPKTVERFEYSQPGAELHQTIIDEPLFRELDQFGTGYPLLVASVPEYQENVDDTDTTPLTLYLPFQDPANIGAVVRTAVAFGVESLVLLKEAANPFHPKSIRASSGAVFVAPFSAGPSISELRNETKPLIGLDADGDHLHTFTFPDQCGLLPGIEGPGLDDGAALSYRVAVPMDGPVESLNAVVATAIVLYAWKQQQTLNESHDTC